MMSRGIDVTVPVANQPQVAPEDRLTVSITAEGRIYVGDKPVNLVLLEDRLARHVCRGARRRSSTCARTSGCQYGQVIQVVDKMKSAGVEQIGFAYELPPGAKRAGERSGRPASRRTPADARRGLPRRMLGVPGRAPGAARHRVRLALARSRSRHPDQGGGRLRGRAAARRWWRPQTRRAAGLPPRPSRRSSQSRKRPLRSRPEGPEAAEGRAEEGAARSSTRGRRRKNPEKRAVARERASPPTTRASRQRPGRRARVRVQRAALPAWPSGRPGPGVPDGTDSGGDWYLAGVQQKIWMIWTQQVKAGFNEPIGITFTILADGSVTEVQVTKPSQATLLNLAAQRAVLSGGSFRAATQGIWNQPLHDPGAVQAHLLGPEATSGARSSGRRSVWGSLRGSARAALSNHPTRRRS